jgi:hypothetical protein
MRRALWATAEAAAENEELSVADATNALVALFRARVALITTDDELREAGDSVVQLIATMMHLAHTHGFQQLHEVELNEALFNLHPLFPFTE